MKRSLVSFCLLSLILFSCSKTKPEEIALKFYQAVISDDLVTAKTFCLPSAIEEIDRLEKIEAFQRNVNKGTMEIMEVVLKNPDFHEGDTAIVNYKIADYKNYLTLVNKEKDWMIAMSTTLKQLPILEFESFDFTDRILKNSKLFHENYLGTYVVIKNVAPLDSKYEWGEGQTAIPISNTRQMLYANQDPRKYNEWGGKVSHVSYKLFNKEISYNPNLPLNDYNCQNLRFVMLGLDAADLSSLKFADYDTSKDWDEALRAYNIKSIAIIRGEYLGYSFTSSNYAVFINKCRVLNMTTE